MKNLTAKDIAIWTIAIVLFFPTLLAVNESGNLWVNLAGFAYIGLLFIGARTNIGKMFIKRFMKIEGKLFGSIK